VQLTFPAANFVYRKLHITGARRGNSVIWERQRPVARRGSCIISPLVNFGIITFYTDFRVLGSSLSLILDTIEVIIIV